MPETESAVNSTRLKNLHEIVNGFNAVFGHEGKIRANTPSNGHLFFQICYDIPTPPRENRSAGEAESLFRMLLKTQSTTP